MDASLLSWHKLIPGIEDSVLDICITFSRDYDARKGQEICPNKVFGLVMRV